MFEQAPLTANGWDRVTDFASGQDRLVFEEDMYTLLIAGTGDQIHAEFFH